MMNRASFLMLVLGVLVGLHRTDQLQLLSALVVGTQSWNNVMLKGLPWKQTEIILSFLRLHPSSVFQTLLLIMRATPFLLWDSCQQ